MTKPIIEILCDLDPTAAGIARDMLRKHLSQFTAEAQEERFEVILRGMATRYKPKKGKD